MVATLMEEKTMERKTIRVSKKRQITIPKDFFEQLNLSNEVECSLEDGAIVIRPIRRHTGDDFSVEILKELVSLGFSDQELVQQFQIERANFKKAIQRMITDTDKLADGTVQGAEFADIFESED